MLKSTISHYTMISSSCNQYCREAYLSFSCGWLNEITSFLTIVLDITGLLFGLVLRYAIYLHPHKRVYNGALFVVYFGELLATDYLKTQSGKGSGIIFFVLFVSLKL